MSSTIKNLKKRHIKVIPVNPTEILIAPESEVFLPTSMEATPNVTYVVTAENMPNVVGANDIGYRAGVFIGLAFRCQGVSSNIYCKIYVNGALYNTVSGSTSTRIQTTLSMVVDCNVGDVITLFCYCNVASNAALSYVRHGLNVRSFGNFVLRNKPLAITSIKIIDVSNGLNMNNSSKSFSFSTTTSSMVGVKFSKNADSKYVTTPESITMYGNSGTEGKFFGGIMGGQPRNVTSMQYCLGISSSFNDYTFSTTSVDTNISLPPIITIAEMEIEYIML